MATRRFRRPVIVSKCQAELPGIPARLRIELLTEPPSELRVCSQRRRPVAQLAKDGHVPPETVLVIRRERTRPPGSLQRRLRSTFSQFLFHQRPGCRSYLRPEMHAFPLYPLLQVAGAVVDEHSREEVALVEAQCLPPTPGTHCALHGSRVTPHPVGGERDLFLAGTHDHAVAERVPEMKERLTETAPGLVLAGAGPEEGQEDIAMLEPVACGEREVGEEGESLGLNVDRLAARTVPYQLQTTEGDEPEHGRAFDASDEPNRYPALSDA